MKMLTLETLAFAISLTALGANAQMPGAPSLPEASDGRALPVVAPSTETPSPSMGAQPNQGDKVSPADSTGTDADTDSQSTPAPADNAQNPASRKAPPSLMPPSIDRAHGAARASTDGTDEASASAHNRTTSEGPSPSMTPTPESASPPAFSPETSTSVNVSPEIRAQCRALSGQAYADCIKVVNPNRAD